MTPKASSIEVKEKPAFDVAVVRHKGPFRAGDGEAFMGVMQRMFAWAEPRGLVRFPETQLLATYEIDPDVPREDALRMAICLTVPPETPAEGEVERCVLPAGRYAVARHELLPPEYQAAWDQLIEEWIPAQGLTIDERPCYEHYLNDPDTHPEGRCIVDICVPVK
ncbi:GyrI-like domain-containing protein [bacterium]|nr:GyrI-like domain-containing protein [bacterium]